MSRIGRKPVALPSGVTVTVKSGSLTVEGPKGKLSYVLLPEVKVEVSEKEALVTRVDDSAKSKARHGLTRAILANMVQGTSQGYTKQLEVIGVGFKAAVKPKTLELQLGFSHPVNFNIPVGITITQDEKNKNLLTITGIDKQLVGQTAAQIRELKPPEPYKGKGIKYTDETIRRKVGKAATAKSA